MNVVCLVGNLCKDNVLRKSGEVSVYQNTIAVGRNFKNKDTDQYESDYINIVAFGTTADYLGKYTSKGSKIELAGRWQHRSYQDNEGNTRYVDECVIERARTLTPQQKEEVPAPEPPTKEEPKPSYNSIYDIPEEELPF